MKASAVCARDKMLNIQEYNAIENTPASRRRDARPVCLHCGIALIAALCLSACASMQYAGTYKQQVLGRPLPTSEAAKLEECAWIRDEMGRQQDGWSRRLLYAEGREATVSRATLEQNLIVLESRAKAAHCNA